MVNMQIVQIAFICFPNYVRTFEEPDLDLKLSEELVASMREVKVIT